MLANLPSLKNFIFDIQRFADDEGEWVTEDDSVSYQQDGETLFTIDGLNSSEGLTLDKKVVTVNETALKSRVKDAITIDNGYKFSFGGGGILSGTEEDATIEEDGVYQFAEGFTGTVEIHAQNVKLVGTGVNLSEVYINVTAASANLWIQDLNITNEEWVNTIKFGSGTNNLIVQGTNNLTNTANNKHNQALINIGGGLNILGDGILTAELTGDGAAIGTDSAEDLSDSNINIGGSVAINATGAAARASAQVMTTAQLAT